MVSLDNPGLLTKCDVVVTVILKHAWSLLYLNNHHIYMPNTIYTLICPKQTWHNSLLVCHTVSVSVQASLVMVS